MILNGKVTFLEVHLGMKSQLLCIEISSPAHKHLTFLFINSNKVKQSSKPEMSEIEKKRDSGELRRLG